VRGQKVALVKVARAKEMRTQPTLEEDLLWRRLRRNALGHHFRRQQVIAGFIVDFYCHQAKLVVEVDGPIHDLRSDYDTARDAVLTDTGLRVVRVRSADVRERIGEVLTALVKACSPSLVGKG
jgi:very-short-patch-repair endonuclease